MTYVALESVTSLSILWLSCNIRCAHELRHQGLPGMTGWPHLWPTGDELEMDLQLEKAAHLIFYRVLWSCKGVPLLRLDRH